MVRLREIPRTATFAWSPGTALPLLATGTKAGAVDADFSNETQLELWDLKLGDSAQGIELQPSASIGTDSRFHDIAWGPASGGHPRGIIAGALENGSLDLWDAEKLYNGASGSFLSRTTKHSGAIKSLQFNPFRPELLATAGAKGELFISDLNNVANPFRLGNPAARADDYESLDWNKKVPHILVTGSSGGFVTVWDVKAKKESLTLNNFGRKPVSAVAWDPDVPTKLITAIPNDTDPLILVWDLRNSNAPERTMLAHEQGVLSLSWCRQDSDLLLSCGKDNRTICWNPHTGQPLGEFPVVTNWTFQTKWNPHNPNLLATASFDGKIAVQTIQNTKPPTDQVAASQSQPLDDEDFFAKAQTQPQVGGFSLPKAPKWLERPVSASFGFGGKIVTVGREAPAKGGARTSKIQVQPFVIDSEVGTATEDFEQSLKEGDLASICESRIAQAKSEEEKADWKVIETLISENPRKGLIEYLGLSATSSTIESPPVPVPASSDAERSEGTLSALPNGSAKAKDNRLSAFFENTGDSDQFLSELAATKGAKTNNPFQIYTGSESEADKEITHALVLGQFEKALDVCLKEDRMSDAFMVAICGGQKCIDKAQTAYFTKKAQGPNYLRLLASVVGKNLWDIVYNADIANWKDAIAILCTYAEEKEFPDLCEALGDRLRDGNVENGSVSGLRKDASFCYLVGSKLEKVVSIWVEELGENEETSLGQSSANSTFAIHVRSLQDFIEKVTVFREVTKFQDTDRQKSSDWKLSALYDKYLEYADIVSAHGQLPIAERYLNLLPTNYPAAEVAKNRVAQASRKPTSNLVGRQPVATARSTQRVQPVISGFAPVQQQSVFPPSAATNIHGPAPAPVSASASVPSQVPPVVNPYAGLAAAQPANPYAPSAAATAYSGSAYQSPQQASHIAAVGPPPTQALAAAGAGAARGVPATTPSVMPPPPPKASATANWNDTPEFLKTTSSRRGTPGAGTVTSPFPNQPSFVAPPPPAPFNGQQRATPPLAPPPKGPAPPARMTSPLVSGVVPHMQHPDRPPSAAASAYAPHVSSPQLGAAPQQHTIPRGPSPYNPPPAGPPSSNRYAPAPPAPVPQQVSSQMAPPPTMVAARPGPPPPNPYASMSTGVSQQQSPGNFPPTQPFPPQPSPAQFQGPAAGSIQGSRPSTAQSHRAPSPAQPKFPPGDRSHIPEQARPVYEILSNEMQRVKSQAPSSFRAQVNDTEKRLNILFDHLNNEDLLKSDTITNMAHLAGALQSRNYVEAQAIQVDLMTNKTEECGQWMVGVRRLIGMSRATPI
ncbi:hypothetical protein L228DRAFT_250390 [Xylona heveae TC161]|uniref:Protein transport protein SEC31 n=1 Tax=Xylona heveae (strain CBS 132557 / TC161) TaxID=1328760 RepID=A0A165A5C5_XYLHT|nr:hypothetical protein L228DRAFT_250390 [Xylona heveae TC161]KZF19973.1 hypothetical protein L228DRAFT_250390 [Xylona heveae TC161]